MASKWYVEVNLRNGKALAIGDDYVSGSADLTESDNALIREAGKSLLAFVGEPHNTQMQLDEPKQCKPFDYCDKRKENCCGSWCPDYPAHD